MSKEYQEYDVVDLCQLLEYLTQDSCQRLDLLSKFATLTDTQRALARQKMLLVLCLQRLSP